MYLMNLNKSFLVEGVSSRFKALMSKSCGSLKNCFFLSMLDAEVPDQLMEDLQTTLKHGIIYDTTLKLNVLEEPRWFHASIYQRFEEGEVIGYQVKLEAADPSELNINKNLFRKLKQGKIGFEHGIPTRPKNLNSELAQANWPTRIK